MIGFIRRIYKRLTIRSRADRIGTELTQGDLVIPLPISWRVDMDDSHLWRHLVRLNRIRRGLKPFKRPVKPNLSLINGTSWESEWYLERIGVKKTRAV